MSIPFFVFLALLSLGKMFSSCIFREFLTIIATPKMCCFPFLIICSYFKHPDTAGGISKKESKGKKKTKGARIGYRRKTSTKKQAVSFFTLFFMDSSFSSI